MPTPLQIDIPQEQADRITEKKRELGPYIFREAQVQKLCLCMVGFHRNQHTTTNTAKIGGVNCGRKLLLVQSSFQLKIIVKLM